MMAMDEADRIERRLKLRDLRVLMSVVQHGSMVKAAEHLGTSQPAVSRTISELEQSLGLRLLDRSPQGIVPTPYGHALMKRSVCVFDELRQGVKDLAFLADPTSGEVRIAARFATAVIDRLARRHPRVVCHLIVDQTGRTLEERHADLLIGRNLEAINRDLMEAESLYDDPLFVVAPAKSPWFRRRNITLADLMNEPWALPPPGNFVSAEVAEVFRAFGLDLPTATVVTFTGIARIALVARGGFLTIVPGCVVRSVGRDLPIKPLPINLSGTSKPLAILTLRNRTLTPVAQLFIDCAREVAKPLALGKSV
jgi:DNA-binding transcriptional LysR family regulator